MSAGRKLLVPIDGSANSLRALAFVIKRVKKDRRLRMCLLNVQPPLPRSLFVTRTMIAEYHDSKSKEGLARSRGLFGLDPALVDTSLSLREVFKMSKRGKRYTREFRYQIVQLVRAGREIPELSKEFGVSVWSIRNWVKQAARDAGTGDQGLTSLEREELTRLKHEVRQLRLEREILSKAAAWFARENIEIPKRSSDS
jgi:transposase